MQLVGSSRSGGDRQRLGALIERCFGPGERPSARRLRHQVQIFRAVFDQQFVERQRELRPVEGGTVEALRYLLSPRSAAYED
jgi:hypothetical protein